MGSIGAQGFADAVAEGDINLNAALIWHLSSNHFPPLPSGYIPLCLLAIEHAQDEDWDFELEVPDIQPVPRAVVERDGKVFVTVATAIEVFHLDSFIFIESDENY